MTRYKRGILVAEDGKIVGNLAELEVQAGFGVGPLYASVPVKPGRVVGWVRKNAAPLVLGLIIGAYLKGR